MMLLLAFAFPSLFWDQGAASAGALRNAGIDHVSVPAAQLEQWKSIPGIRAEPADLAGAVKLAAPSVDYRIDKASATRDPWLESNGWQFMRRPNGRFYYDVHGAEAAVAAAEAFTFGSGALIRTDSSGLRPLGEMLAFLKNLPGGDLPAIADIGFIDDGSDDAAEVMNLMIRSNLLFRIVPSPDPRLKLTVRMGSGDYPPEDTGNASLMVHDIRAKLTDERRSVRIYGSPVVIARLAGEAGRVRVCLLNYDGANRRVNGIRVRVLGSFPQHSVAVAGISEAKLLDYATDASSTEFTLPELPVYAVIDLLR
jgi:hypothetical protein